MAEELYIEDVLGGVRLHNSGRHGIHILKSVIGSVEVK